MREGAAPCTALLEQPEVFFALAGELKTGLGVFKNGLLAGNLFWRGGEQQRGSVELVRGGVGMLEGSLGVSTALFCLRPLLFLLHMVFLGKVSLAAGLGVGGMISGVWGMEEGVLDLEGVSCLPSASCLPNHQVILLLRAGLLLAACNFLLVLFPEQDILETLSC